MQAELEEISLVSRHQTSNDHHLLPVHARSRPYLHSSVGIDLIIIVPIARHRPFPTYLHAAVHKRKPRVPSHFMIAPDPFLLYPISPFTSSFHFIISFLPSAQLPLFFLLNFPPLPIVLPCIFMSLHEHPYPLN